MPDTDDASTPSRVASFEVVTGESSRSASEYTALR